LNHARGPIILSLFAWGQLGKVVVFDYNRSGNYVRDYVKPYDPKSVKQLAHRAIFAAGMEAWRALPHPTQQEWDGRARKLHMLGMNLYMRSYLNSH
jgi:hypothetical protein